MRVAVCGSHSVGKSTLIAAFLSRHPDYAHEPEAFEVLGDDIELTESGAPTPDGLRSLLSYTLSAVQGRAGDACVMFERCPADYLAYAAAAGSAWPPGEIQEFLEAHLPIVRASLQDLDLLAYVPLSTVVRPGEGKRFRRRVDAWLRRVLFDDEYEMLTDSRAPRVAGLPAAPERQLGALSRLVQNVHG